MGLFDTAARVGMAIGSGGLSETVPALLGGGDAPPMSLEEKQRRESLNTANNLRGNLAQNANTYRNNLEGTRQEMGNQAEEASRRGLAQSLAGVDRGANRRGLLYSGLRQQDQAGVRAQAANQLAQQKAQIHQDTETQAEQMEGGALNAGFQQQQAEQSAADDAYQSALARMQSQQGVTNALFGAGGNIAGRAAARQ